VIEDSKYAKSADCSSDDIGSLQHLTFNPSKNFAEGNVVLFGITVRQQGRKLIIVTKIYEEERRKEIVEKLGIMVKVMMGIVPISRSGVDYAHVVDQKDILVQISKYKMIVDKSSGNMAQEQDIVIETLDLITGEIVPVEFSMKLLRVEKKEKPKRKSI
jgi:hypothetical protein